MSKLKLTEGQIAMIQERLADLDKKKVLKINESQYDRLFKGGFNKASKSMSKDLKKSGIKEGEAKPELNPLEFAQELIVFIKDVIANPRRVPFSTYWDALNISRKELFLMVKKADLLTMMVGEGNVKTYKAKKIGFRKGIKELCKKIMENQLTEDGGGFPAGAEFDPNAPWNQDDAEYNSKREGLKCKKCPLKYVYFNERSDDLMIFKDANGLYAYSGANTPEENYTDFMDIEGIIDDEAIYHYVNVLLEDGEMKIEIDPKLLADGQVVKITPQLKELLIGWYGNDSEMVEILNRLPESTGASSSGAFVGGMSGGPIQKDTGIAPEQALRDISEDEIEETTSMGGAGGINTGRGGNSIEHDVNAFGGGNFMTAGNKLNKEEAMPMIKRQIGESIESDALTPMIQQAISTVDESLGYKDFAIAVANVIKDSYGQHLINPFIKVLTASLGPSDIHLGEEKVNENMGFQLEGNEKLNQEYLAMMSQYGKSTSESEGNMLALKIIDWGKKNGLNIPRSMFPTLGAELKVGQVYTNGNGRAKILKKIDDASFTIRRWGDVEANTVNIGGTELSGWTLMEGKKVLKVTEGQMKRILATEKKK